MLSALDISTSGLVAQRMRMIQISNNIANIQARTPSSGEKVPYQPQTVVFQTDETGHQRGGRREGQFGRDRADRADLEAGTEPSDAIKSGPHAGEVAYPNIDLMTEFTNALEAARSYEANLGPWISPRTWNSRPEDLA